MLKMDKKTIIIIALGIVILIGLCYFLIPKYNLNQQEKGFQIGYEQAVLNIMQQASTCQQVPVVYQNYTLNLFAVECLQQNEMG